MESLCSSAVTPGRIEAPVVRRPKCSSVVKASTFRFWRGNCPEKLASLTLSGPPRSPQSRGERWRVLAHGASGIGGENNGALTNGFSVLIDGDPASIQVHCDDSSMVKVLFLWSRRWSFLLLCYPVRYIKFMPLFGTDLCWIINCYIYTGLEN